MMADPTNRKRKEKPKSKTVHNEGPFSVSILSKNIIPETIIARLRRAFHSLRRNRRRKGSYLQKLTKMKR